MTIDTTPRRTILFTDHRDIFLGDLEWVGADGREIPLINPPPPVVDAYPRNQWVPHGIQLVAQRATKGEPLPEGTTIGRVIRDGGMFRTWYSQVEYPPGRDFGSYSQDPPVAVNVAYRESGDGFTWSKPRLSRIDVPGLTAVDGFTFFIDTNPAAPASERYKAVYMADLKDERRAAEAWQQFQKVHPRHRDVRMREKHMTGIFGLTSPDGLSWKP